jgi:hypothetical protein
MRQRTHLAILFAVAAVLGFAANLAAALDVVWDGGDDVWDGPKWNGGLSAVEVLGVDDGADGFNGPNSNEEQNIFVGMGATVTYDADFLGRDFELFQGSSLTIHEGATWQQTADEFWSENRWTELDPSNLILDNGTFRRIGSVREEGGGALIFGSWQGDDVFDEPEFPLDHQETNVLITNGGRLENEGQLWFGSWGDQAPGLVVNMTINDGTIDLTGGSITASSDAFWDGDLAFTYDRDDQGVPKDETYVINFTGPGTITTDFGIVVATQDETNTWVGGPNQTYEDLWDMGILQANGLSGLDGENFGDYFTVMGTSGLDDYTLTSLVMPPPTGIPGDYNDNGTVEQADLDLVLLNWGADGTTPPNGWTNDLPTGDIDQAELDGVLLNWGDMAGLGAAAGVPEPATWLLVCLTAFAAAARHVKRRA